MDNSIAAAAPTTTTGFGAAMWNERLTSSSQTPKLYHQWIFYGSTYAVLAIKIACMTKGNTYLSHSPPMPSENNNNRAQINRHTVWGAISLSHFRIWRRLHFSLHKFIRGCARMCRRTLFYYYFQILILSLFAFIHVIISWPCTLQIYRGRRWWPVFSWLCKVFRLRSFIVMWIFFFVSFVVCFGMSDALFFAISHVYFVHNSSHRWLWKIWILSVHCCYYAFYY